MDTCRICFGTDGRETMLSPCNCRGSSAFIHQECYERYLEHFPDGVCRVCNARMNVVENPEVGLALGSLVLSVIVLNNAVVPPIIKGVFLAGYAIGIRYLGTRGLLSGRFVTIATGMTMLLLAVRHDAMSLVAVNASLLLLGTLLTLGLYVPIEGILSCAVATICYIYLAFIGMRLLFDTDDIWTNIAFMNFTFMTWYGWYMTRQPLFAAVPD